MKILHTSDWHLGQRLLNNDRQKENERALKWLLETIEKEKIELLIVAGDIFDTMNPPNYARRLYYGFLTQLIPTTCRHIVIIGGNHDSPSMLNAPQELLKNLNVHVIGCAIQPIENEVIELKNNQGKIEAVVAAVPFLRDQDIRLSISGETSMERLERVRQGIYQHYEKIGLAVEKYIPLNVPILATGHLFASGATDNKDINSKIYLGNLENINATEFPEIFDYVALGHIHIAQKVGKQAHIRYSGSLIPLGFNERKDSKVVHVLNIDNHQKPNKDNIQTLKVPKERKLYIIEGDLESVSNQLLALESASDLDIWVEVRVKTDRLIPNLMTILQDLVKGLPIEILKFRVENTYQPIDKQIFIEDLDSLAVEEVFIKKCRSMGKPPEAMEALELTFKELLNWMEEQDVE